MSTKFDTGNTRRTRTIEGIKNRIAFIK